MDFDKPLSPEEGFVVYHALMDTMDIFIMDYMRSKRSADCPYPSLTMMADVVMDFLTTVSHVDLDQKDFNANDPIDALANKIIKYKAENTNPIFNSKELKLFSELDEVDWIKVKKEEPNSPEPLKINFYNTDREWLRSMGIREGNK